MLGIDPKKMSERPAAASAETETVRKIVQQLDQTEPERARYLAGYAYLLSRVAHADHHFSQEETATIERLVMLRGEVPEEQAVLIVQMAKTQNRLFAGTENFLVTREFGRIATHEQKLSLLHCLYAVCSADRSISTVEDNEIRKVSMELQISHEAFVAVRLNYREHLAVLKK